MPSTAKIAQRLVEANQRIEEALTLLNATIPDHQPDYRNRELRVVLDLERIADALESVADVPKKKPLKEVKLADEPILNIIMNDEPEENKEVAFGFNEEEETDPDQEELEDMASEELRTYADSLGVKYPANIGDSTLIRKIIAVQRHRGNQ